MKYNVTKLKANTYKVDVDFSMEDISKAFDHALEHISKEVKLDGFRKGSVPKSLAKEKVDKSKLRGEALNYLLNRTYIQLLNENKYKPMTYPIFDVKKFEEGETGGVEITVVEKPEIKLGDYQKEISKIDKKDNEVATKDIIDAVFKVSSVEVSDVLVESEKNRMLSSLIDQTSKLKLKLEDYLKSVNKNLDTLKKEYEITALNTLKADLLLNEIASKEGIKISDEDIDKTINGIPDEKSKKILNTPNQRLYIKAVLTKSNTIDKLKKYVFADLKKNS